MFVQPLRLVKPVNFNCMLPSSKLLKLLCCALIVLFRNNKRAWLHDTELVNSTFASDLKINSVAVLFYVVQGC